jgi:endonuclease/exonuclease/phosphatase family metal-dependent hydrolase
MSTSTDPPISERLRIMTVNVHKGFALLGRRFVLRELREAVRAVGADLVFLQEIHGVQRGARMTGHAWLDVPHYEYLADQIWPDFAYGRNAVYTDGDHGNALLSKYPIEHSENLDVSAATHERRGLLHCVLRLPRGDRIVHAICVHLGLKPSHRVRQLRQLCDFVNKVVPVREPLLVAGDFNDWRCLAHTPLRQCAGLGEVFVEAHGVAAKTYPAGFPLLRLDRIYVRSVSGHSPLILPARPWNRLSDHAPIAAELRL